MKTLFFLSIGIKLIINAAGLKEVSNKTNYPINMDNLITGLIEEHSMRSIDVGQGLKILNFHTDHLDVKAYVQEDVSALAALRRSHVNYLFLPLWSSCILVSEIHSNHNKTFSASATNYSRFTEEVAKRLEFLSLMINTTSNGTLIADKEIKEEQRVILGLFDKIAENLRKNFDKYERTAADRLEKSRNEIASLEKRIEKANWKLGFIYWPFDVKAAEDQKRNLEKDVQGFHRFLNAMKTYVNWTEEAQKSLWRISEDLAENLRSIVETLDYHQEWLQDIHNFSKEKHLSKELKDQVLIHLDKTINQVHELSCSTMKISSNDKLMNGELERNKNITSKGELNESY